MKKEKGVQSTRKYTKKRKRGKGFRLNSQRQKSMKKIAKSLKYGKTKTQKKEKE